MLSGLLRRKATSETRSVRCSRNSYESGLLSSSVAIHRDPRIHTDKQCSWDKRLMTASVWSPTRVSSKTVPLATASTACFGSPPAVKSAFFALTDSTGGSSANWIASGPDLLEVSYPPVTVAPMPNENDSTYPERQGSTNGSDYEARAGPSIPRRASSADPGPGPSRASIDVSPKARCNARRVPRSG